MGVWLLRCDVVVWRSLAVCGMVVWDSALLFCVGMWNAFGVMVCGVLVIVWQWLRIVVSSVVVVSWCGAAWWSRGLCS